MPNNSRWSFLTSQFGLDHLNSCDLAAVLMLLPSTLLVLLPQWVLIGLLAVWSLVLVLAAGLIPRRAQAGWRTITPLALVLLGVGLISVAGCGQGAEAKPADSKPRELTHSVSPTTLQAASASQPSASAVRTPAAAPPTPEQSRQRFGTALRHVYKALAKAPNKPADVPPLPTPKAVQP
jgi:hypothetical protein